MRHPHYASCRCTLLQTSASATCTKQILGIPNDHVTRFPCHAVGAVPYLSTQNQPISHTCTESDYTKIRDAVAVSGPELLFSKCRQISIVLQYDLAAKVTRDRFLQVEPVPSRKIGRVS